MLLSTFAIFAQDKKQKQQISDVFDEMETGNLVLRFFDALTGNPIKNGTVSIETIGEFESDFEGRIYFEPIEDNVVLNVQFSHPEYITSQFDVELMAGTLFFNRFSISPKMPLGSLRVVIDWGENPRDLDAHFEKAGIYHISYRNMRVSADGTAKLDRDDTDGFGPETITTNNIDENAEYSFYVHKYSNESTKLSDSKCSVKIYGRNNELINVLKVPENLNGNYWNVFKIKNDVILLEN
jgi:hypothetical protein